MKGYTWRLGDRLNSYTICLDGVGLKPEEVVSILNNPNPVRVQPSHYSSDGMSPVDCFREGLIGIEEYKGFCKGNVIKYVVRAGKKGGESALKDYSKAVDYLFLLIDMEK